MKGYEKLEQHLIHQGKVVGFYEDIVKLPSGKVVTWDLVKHKGAAAVVPVTDKGTILLVRQYRNALDQETLEILAGGIEPGKHLWSVSQERLKKKQVLLLENDPPNDCDHSHRFL